MGAPRDPNGRARFIPARLLLLKVARQLLEDEMSPTRTDSDMMDFEPVPQDVRAPRFAVTACRVWGFFCAALLIAAVLVEISRVEMTTWPIPWREYLAWICFDALFLLGAYAGFDFLCGARCDETKQDD